MLYIDQLTKLSTRLKPPNNKLVWLLTFLVLAGCVIGFSQFSKPDSSMQSAETVSVLPVEVINATSVQSYQVARAYTGEVVSRRSSELGFEQAGQLINITVDEGTWVEAGTPLAVLDTDTLKVQRLQLLAQRNQAVAKLQELQAGPREEAIATARARVTEVTEELQLEQTRRDRRETLYQEGAISREQLDEVSSEMGSTQARLAQANSQLEELLAGTRREQIAAQEAVVQALDADLASLALELQKATLTAPFSGTISVRLIDEGTVVSSGQPILRLVEDGVLEARVGVPVAAAMQIQPGSQHSLQIDQKTYSATVSSLQPELDVSTRTISVVLQLDAEATETVKPGQLSRLELVDTVSTSGYWLPTSALVQGTQGLWFCYVLEKQQAQSNSTTPVSLEVGFDVQRSEIEVLHTEGDRVLVRGTLQSGDQVISSGTHRVTPGQQVRPIRNERGSL